MCEALWKSTPLNLCTCLIYSQIFRHWLPPLSDPNLLLYYHNLSVLSICSCCNRRKAYETVCSWPCWEHCPHKVTWTKAFNSLLRFLRLASLPFLHSALCGNRRTFLIYKVDELTSLCTYIVGDLVDFFKDDLIKYLCSNGVRCALFLAHVLSITTAIKFPGIGFERCSSNEVQLRIAINTV